MKLSIEHIAIKTGVMKGKMELYRLTAGKKVSGKHCHDWYSGQLEHLATYGDATEARAHLIDGNPDGADQWPEVYDEAGNRVVLKNGKLIKI